MQYRDQAADEVVTLTLLHLLTSVFILVLEIKNVQEMAVLLCDLNPPPTLMQR